jgi:hypothetical protein
MKTTRLEFDAQDQGTPQHSTASFRPRSIARATVLGAVAILLNVALASHASAGNVLKVDPTDPSAYASIQNAISAASAGDIIVVKPKPPIAGIPFSGLYSTITIDKGITITAEAGATVRASRVIIQNVSAGETVVLKGITFERANPSASNGASNLVADENSGDLWIEDCDFILSTEVFQPVVSVPATPALPAVHINPSAEITPGFVVFVRCTIEGTRGATKASGPMAGWQMEAGHGLVVDHAAVSVWDSVVTGGDGQPGHMTTGLPGGDGGDAIRADDSYILCAGTTLAAGDGGPGASGTGCVPGGDGGVGLRLLGAAWSEVLDSSLSGGTAGPGAGACAAGTAGLSSVGPVSNLVGPSHSLDCQSPKREGQNLHLTASGPQNGWYLIDTDTDAIFGIGTSSIQAVQHIVGIGAAGGHVPLHPQFLGQYGSSPSVIQFPLSGLLGGQQGMVFFFQSVGIDTYPGGTQTYSAPSALILLDASL